MEAEDWAKLLSQSWSSMRHVCPHCRVMVGWWHVTTITDSHQSWLLVWLFFLLLCISFIYLLVNRILFSVSFPFLLSSKLLRCLWETVPLRLYQRTGWQHLLKQNLQVKVATVIWNENARTVTLGNFAVLVEWLYV